MSNVDRLNRAAVSPSSRLRLYSALSEVFIFVLYVFVLLTYLAYQLDTAETAVSATRKHS